MRPRWWLCLTIPALGWALACSLNPQPLPPGLQSADGGGVSDGSLNNSGDHHDAGATDTGAGTDGGTPPPAPPDGSTDAPTDSSSDAGDAEPDTTDAPAEAEDASGD